MSINYAHLNKKKSRDPVLEVVQDLLICQLAQAGADVMDIRKVAGVQMNRVTRISRVLNKARKKKKATTNG